jgi:hypothetical protein
MRRRSGGASARALEREFGISNQAIGKFFKREDAKRAAELDRANQQAREWRNARRRGDLTSPDPARAPEHRKPEPADGGPPLEEHSAQPSAERRIPFSRNTPVFETEEERFNYYAARRHLSEIDMLNWNDVRRGKLTPYERRAREAAKKTL